MSKKKRNATSEEKRQDVFHYLRAALAVLFLVFLVLLSYFTYQFGRMVFSDHAMTTPGNAYTYEITITENEPAITVGTELAKNKIIESGLAFYVQTIIYDCKMQPGTFIMTSGMSSKAIAKYLNQEYQNSHQEKRE